MVNAPRRRGPGSGDRTANAHGGDRAVSEVVSFVLTFATITIMIGLLYSAGFVSIERLQAGNQMQNAEGVFFAMSENFEELQEGQAPKRAGSLDLDVGASLSVSDESVLEVGVNDGTGPVISKTLETRSIDYRLEDRTVGYEAGAVFRSDDGGSAMVGEPTGLVCSPESDSAVLTVVSLADPGNVSVASGTVTITAVQRSSTLLYPTDRTDPGGIENVSVRVDSPREDAWGRHLADAEGWDGPDGDGRYVCPDVDRAFVRHTVIEIHATG